MKPTKHPEGPGRRGWIAVAVLALALLIPATAANAATVTTTEDAGPGSLRQVIADAKSGDTINLPPGTYRLTKGQLSIRGKSLRIVGANPATTIISGSKSSRIFEIVNFEGSFTVAGVTLKEARLGGGTVEGAAIRFFGGDLTLRNDVITRNVAERPGEFIFAAIVAAEGDNITIADTKVAGNFVNADGKPGSAGGTIFGGGMGINGIESLTVERLSVEGNLVTARGGNGPASAEQEGGKILGAGAILQSSGTLQISDSTFAGNVGDATNGPGGKGGREEAGGLDVRVPNGKGRLERVTIANNALRPGSTGIAQGGGMNVENNTETPVEVIGSTIASNSIEGTNVSAEEGLVTVGGNVAANASNPPGGLVSFANSIIANGIGPEGSENCGVDFVEADAPFPFIDKGFNFDSAGECGFGEESSIAKADPLLGPLQDNGGPTKTMEPAADSPVIDQGSAFGATVDQRGFTRPVDLPGVPNSRAVGADGTDIGAVEVQGSR